MLASGCRVHTEMKTPWKAYGRSNLKIRRQYHPAADPGSWSIPNASRACGGPGAPSRRLLCKAQCRRTDFSQAPKPRMAGKFQTAESRDACQNRNEHGFARAYGQGGSYPAGLEHDTLTPSPAAGQDPGDRTPSRPQASGCGGWDLRFTEPARAERGQCKPSLRSIEVSSRQTPGGRSRSPRVPILTRVSRKVGWPMAPPKLHPAGGKGP